MSSFYKILTNKLTNKNYSCNMFFSPFVALILFRTEHILQHVSV